MSARTRSSLRPPTWRSRRLDRSWIDSHPQPPSITPLRRPLGKKGRNAFFGVGVEQVFHHDPEGVLVGIGQAHWELRVERLLAEANSMRRFFLDALRKLHCIGPPTSARHHPVGN